MNGPEHYRAAEAALEALKNVERGDPCEVSFIAEAQAHATLALVAATAGQNNGKWMHPSWQDVLVSDTDRGRQEHPDAERSPF